MSKNFTVPKLLQPPELKSLEYVRVPASSVTSKKSLAVILVTNAILVSFEDVELKNWVDAKIRTSTENVIFVFTSELLRQSYRAENLLQYIKNKNVLTGVVE